MVEKNIVSEPYIISRPIHKVNKTPLMNRTNHFNNTGLTSTPTKSHQMDPEQKKLSILNDIIREMNEFQSNEDQQENLLYDVGLSEVMKYTYPNIHISSTHFCMDYSDSDESELADIDGKDLTDPIKATTNQIDFTDSDDSSDLEDIHDMNISDQNKVLDKIFGIFKFQLCSH